MITEWHLLDTGFCTVPERFAYRAQTRRRVPCHGVCVLLRHNTEGWLLFDTGYAPRVLQATKRFPYRLYALMTPMTIPAQSSAAIQLARFGLQPDAVSVVIVSHFHADHIGGLLDFGTARFVAARAGFNAVQGRHGFDAVRRAFLPQLLPLDFAARATWQEALPLGEPVPGFAETRDLFGDGSVRLVALPGHAKGQIGLIAKTTAADTLFFVADAVYAARSIRRNIAPHSITRLFADDPHADNDTRARLHAYHCAVPQTILLPTHCPETLARCIR